MIKVVDQVEMVAVYSIQGVSCPPSSWDRLQASVVDIYPLDLYIHIINFKMAPQIVGLLL